MTAYPKMTAEEWKAEYAEVTREYEELKARGLNLNMARGKPGKAQLDLVSDIFSLMQKTEDYVSDGVDVRNYGELSGLPAAKRLFAEILGCRPEQVFVGGNASLQLMYDAISKAYTHGMLHSEKPWGKLETVKWLCPAPGYDRHFRICQSFGMELITVPMTEEGPDMDMVERLVRDPAVKGMWNVPKYSNPQGIIYSAETVQRLAAMRPAAPDFMLMWDNAYCIHELEGEFVPFPDILSLCRQAGNGDMVYEFASTSKITFPGAGVAVMACSEANMAHMLSLIGVQTIGYDKINQLRHVRYLKDRSHTLALMQRQYVEWGNDSVEIRREMEFVRAYLGLQKYRFGERLSYSLEVEEDCLDIKIPKMTVVTFVENACVHGIEAKTAPGWIFVRICQKQKALYLEVEDTGCGMDASQMQELKERMLNASIDMLKDGGRVGIINACLRLKMVFGEQVAFDIEGEQGVGTTVSIRMPL